MRRTSVLCWILLLSSMWLGAQQNHSSENAVNWGDTSGPNDVAVRGCLTGSDGTFYLRDASNRVWEIAGNLSELRDVSGHQVLIAGTRGGPGAAAIAASQSLMDSEAPESFPWTLSASKIRSIADHCTMSP